MRRRGFTIFELIVVIAIIGILAVVFYRKSSGKEDSAKLQATLNIAQQLHSAVQQWKEKNGQLNTSNLSLNALISSGVWSSTVTQTPFGGNIQIDSDGTSYQYRIHLGAIPDSVKTGFVNLARSRGMVPDISNPSDCVLIFNLW